jgi:hypothetical protein
MKRKAHEQSVDAESGCRSSKAIKYSRGDLVLVNCNVTDFMYGTPSVPMFPLIIELWTTCLLSECEALVAPGGPDDVRELLSFTKRTTRDHMWTKHIKIGFKISQFDRRGWKVEHQAPQATGSIHGIVNFSAMLKRHSELLQLCFKNEANADHIMYNIGLFKLHG